MKFMRLSACFAAIALLVASLPATAIPMRGLYEASVPVPDQSPQQREPALRRALEAVLVRVTGQRHPGVASSLLDRANVLVQGYGYENAPGGTGLRLRAQFDPRAVDASLRALGVPVWGTNRLSHVVWIALRDDGQQRGLLDAPGIAARAPAVAATAEARGLPFVYPQLDATERKLATFNDVWAGKFAGVQGASRNYNANLMLIGRVGREGGTWVGRWTVINNVGATDEWTVALPTLEEALAAGIHELADRQAQRFSIQAGSAREQRLRVAGVDSLADYGRVLNYVRGLNPVRGAQVESVRAGEMTLRLQVEGDPDLLQRVIVAGRTLRRSDSDVDAYVLVR